MRTLGIVLLAAACGSSTAASPPPDAAQAAAADAAARLEGNWTLIQFQPQAPLEPMLQSLLNAQMNQLRVNFHAGSMRIEGVGITAERKYRVTQAAADGFSITVIDPTNVEYQSTGAFQGIDVMFTCQSDPWRGQGRLRRAP